VLTQVIAASQQEYLDSLKKMQHQKNEIESGQSSGQETPETKSEESSDSCESAKDDKSDS
jgi:hypothetical protein